MSILLFLVLLSTLVVLHELGHFVAARIFGIKAEEFGVGFPPRLIGFVRENGTWKKVSRTDRRSYKNTIWSLNWLFLGGFVRIKGETEQGATDADSINAKPIWQRMVVIVAGVVMNWITGAVLLSVVLMIGTTIVLDGVPVTATITNRSVTITDVLVGAPAARAGFEIGDHVQSIDGLGVASAEALRDAIRTRGVAEIHFTIERRNDTKLLVATPEDLKEIGHTGIGVGLADTGRVSLPFGQALLGGVRMAWAMTLAIFSAFGHLLNGIVRLQGVPSDISGPVGIAVETGKVAQQGFVAVLQFAAVLSLNLGVLNVLPIPALDGGRFFFLLLEKIRRKPLGRNAEIRIHNTAFALLVLLLVVVTMRDVYRLGSELLGGFMASRG